MTDHKDRFRFVSLLALELENGDIKLPSLPDVVQKIRSVLEKDDCNFEQVSMAVSVDPVLVSRLFVFANSAFHNRANVDVETLAAAIGRLGFEVVRNTAVSMAIKQVYISEKHSKSAKYLRAVWARSMKLSSMCFAVARGCPSLNEETAFMCGSLHEVGKLYMITKAEDFPSFLGDSATFQAVLDEWNPQISKSIIEGWNFSDKVAESTDVEHYLDTDPTSQPAFVDVVYVARLLLDGSDTDSLPLDEIPACTKLGINKDSVANVMHLYREKLSAMQQSLA